MDSELYWKPVELPGWKGCDAQQEVQLEARHWWYAPEVNTGAKTNLLTDVLDNRSE